MVMTGVVVAAAVACGGAMKGSEQRELWVKENKNEEGKREKNRLERKMLMGQIIRVGSTRSRILRNCHLVVKLRN